MNNSFYLQNTKLIAELNALPRLNEKEFNLLHSKYLAAVGEEKDRLRVYLISSQLRFLVRPSMKYSSRDLSIFGDMLAAGYAKLLGAIDAYDSSRKVSFWRFISLNVARAIHSEFHKIAFGKLSGYTRLHDLAEYQQGKVSTAPVTVHVDDDILSELLSTNETALTEICKSDYIDELTETLRPDRKQLIIDWAINGMSGKELAEKYGCSEKGIESRLSTACRDVRNHGVEVGLLDERYRTASTKYECYSIITDRSSRESKERRRKKRR